MNGTAIDRCKVPSAFWATVKHIGISPVALLRQARLPATLHVDPRHHVTTAQYFALWRALEELKPDPGLGVRLVEHTETSVYPPASLAAFYARDYRDGLHRMARFKELCSPEQLHLEIDGADCMLWSVWPCADGPEPAISTDVTFASIVELGRRGTRQHIVPRRIELTRPRQIGELQRYFQCPIRFKAPANRLVLDTADLDRPFPGHNSDLLDMLTPALAAALGELKARSSVTEQVKIVLKRGLASGRPDLSDVASDLGMSERTLQRRITEEGVSFRELLVEARQEVGRRLLADPTIDIDEVACLLGYQDPSSFYRAFRDWEGITPNRWRELNGDKLH
ncbi:MAG: AraC family transcriptional regulator [Rhodopseudomonas sp.]|uniref:AraC family transcriptional regulator n=1 Tax=Rhodopseudomonas sp. TaxID=1078 RepID=UPI0039E67825